MFIKYLICIFNCKNIWRKFTKDKDDGSKKMWDI